MKIFYSLFLFLFVFWGCSQGQFSRNLNAPPQEIAEANAQQSASPAKYSSYYGFLDTLISRKDIITDRNFNSRVPRLRKDTLRSRAGVELVEWLPLPECPISYHAYLPIEKAETPVKSFFKVNEQKISCSQLPLLEIGSHGIEKFSFKGKRFLYVSAVADKNRLETRHTGIHHIFSVDQPRITLNTFTHHEDLTGLLYGDLNRDKNLDCLSIKNAQSDAPAFSSTEHEQLEAHGINPKFCYKILAYSYSGQQWQELTDEGGKPYYILVQLNNPAESENFRIIDYYWMNKI